MPKVDYPSWINPEYFECILSRKFKNSSIKVREVQVEPCSATGDGFLSILLRAHVKYVMNSKEKIESFVVKLNTVNEFAIEKIGANGFDVQNKEMLFFEVIAPQIEKILKKIGEHENLIPEVIAVDRNQDSLVFEDLKAKDYVMVDRKSGMSDTSTRVALKKIAKFHAASLIIHRKQPRAFDSFDVGMFSRKLDAFNDAYLSIFELLTEEVETWIGYEKYARKMKKLLPSLIEAALRCFDNDPGDFCVLNHGDLWTNNFMFKLGDDNEIVDVILIDFQFCHWASPALDLIHFLYTSLNEDIFNQEKIEEFVQFFYYELKNMLEKLDYDVSEYPTLHDFQLQMMKKLFYALLYTSVIFPIMTTDDVDNDFIAHHSRDERSTNFKRRLLKGEKFQRIMKKMLPVFDQKGLLDLELV